MENSYTLNALLTSLKNLKSLVKIYNKLFLNILNYIKIFINEKESKKNNFKITYKSKLGLKSNLKLNSKLIANKEKIQNSLNYEFEFESYFLKF